MSTMNLSQARVVDPILSGVMQGYSDQEFVGGKLFPQVPVNVAAGKVLEFGKEAFMQYATQRAPGANTKRITFGYQGKPFALEQHAIDAQVPREFLRDASQVPGIDLGSRAVRLTQKVNLRTLEIQQAALAVNAANYDAQHKIALAGATKWSTATGVPVTDIDNAREAIRSTCGQYPNVAVFGPPAFNSAKNNPNVIDRFKYTSNQVVSPQMLAALFQIEQIYVGKAVVSTDAGVFSDIWGNNVVLAYVPNVPQSMEEPSYGYTYTMEGHPLVEPARWDADTKSWVYGTSFERAPVLTGIVAGYLIQNPN